MREAGGEMEARSSQNVEIVSSSYKETYMRRLFVILALVAALCLGGFTFADVEPVVEESSALFTVGPVDVLSLDPSYGMLLVVGADEDSAVGEDDVAQMVTISLAEYSFDIPTNIATFNVALGVDVGIEINDGVSLDSALGGALTVGGLEEVIAKGVEYVPWLGKRVSPFIMLLDGRIGYGGLYAIGEGEFRHGVYVGVISFTLDF